MIYTQVQRMRKQAAESFWGTARRGKVTSGNMNQQQYNNYKKWEQDFDDDINAAERRMNDQIWANKRKQNNKVNMQYRQPNTNTRSNVVKQQPTIRQADNNVSDIEGTFR